MRTNLITSMLVAAFLIIAAAPLLHPFGAVKQASSSQRLLSGAQIDAATQALFERSCQSCHSQRTMWPWYSYVPPVSWLIERDVSRARASMNLSHWDQYSTEERQSRLGAIAATVRNRQMPPGRFTLLHPETMLSPTDRERIYAWARAERRRLRVSIHQASANAHLP
jgi:mono/diheme cytochrome c family protein